MDYGHPCPHSKKFIQNSVNFLRAHTAWRHQKTADGVAQPSAPEPETKQEHNIGDALNSREDVMKALAGALDFLDRNEPSNPATLLLRRVMRLLSMESLDLVKDIAPEALAQIEAIRRRDQ